MTDNKELNEDNELVLLEESDIMIDRIMLYIKQIKEQRDKLKMENDKLNEECDRRVGSDDYDAVCLENDKLKEENEKLQLSLDCHSAELSFLDPNGNLSAMNEYEAFNEYLKDTYSEEKYKNIYEAMEIGEHLEE